MDSDGHHALINSIDTSRNSHTSEYLQTLAEAELKKYTSEYHVTVGSFETDNTGNVAKMRRELAANDNEII